MSFVVRLEGTDKQLEDAIAKGEIEEHEIPVQHVQHLEKSFASFNAGEASCFVLAKENSWRVATDDGKAKEFVRTELGNAYVVTTFDILLEGIDFGVINKKDAESLLEEMESKAHFLYKQQHEYKSFISTLKRR